MLATLLAAGGLISIPILIHIFNRTRYRKINWAAMEFLLAAYKKTRRRMQFEHLLLLILRIMAMLFLAFAFFPQGITGATDSVLDSLDISLASTADSGRQQHMICVVDDSASMRYLSGNSTRVEAYTKALEHTRRYIGALNEDRDHVTLVFPASLAFQQAAEKKESGEEEAAAVVLREMTPKNALLALESHKPTFGRAEMLSTFKYVASKVNSLAKGDSAPSVLVVSDFQANEWEFANSESTEHQAFGAILEDINAVLESKNSRMVFVNALSSDSSPRTNVGITAVNLRSKIVGVGMSYDIEVDVTYSTSDTVGGEFSANLEFQVDGENIRRFDAPVKIAAGETVSVRQTMPPLSSAGSHRVKVRLAKLGDDRFPEDNEAYLSVYAREEIPILIVNGAPKNETNAVDEVEYLRIALGISGAVDESGNEIQRFTPNRVTVVEADKLNSTLIKNASVIILANLSKLQAKYLTAIEEKVSTGGAAVFFTLGNRVDIEEFNQEFWKRGKGLSPVKLVKERAYNEAEETLNMLRMEIVDMTPSSPLAELKAPANIVAEPAIMNWIECQLPQDVKDAKDTPEANTVMTVLATPESSPLLVTRPYQGGQTALLTTSVDGDWHEMWSLETMPIFDLVHEITASLSGADSRRRRLNVGQQIVIDLNLEPSGYTIFAPQEGAIPTTQTELDETTARVIFNETFTPGVYTLKPSAEEGKSGKSTHFFSVLMPQEESDFSVLGNNANSVSAISSVMVPLAEKYEALNFETEEATTEEIAGATGDRTMDRWLFFVGLAMLCLVAEIAVTVLTGRRKEA